MYYIRPPFLTWVTPHTIAATQKIGAGTTFAVTTGAVITGAVVTGTVVVIVDAAIGIDQDVMAGRGI